MNCPNCDAINDENSVVCSACGAELNQNTTSQNDDENLKNKNYTETDIEQKPVLKKEYSSTKPIVSVVMSFLVFNIIGVILSVMSLARYNKYEQALFAGDIQKAQMFGKSSQKLAKAAIVITVIILIIRPILVVAFLLIGADTMGLVGDGSLMASQGSASAAMLRASI